jgi:nucleoside-diphosphate-sugar epimerase
MRILVIGGTGFIGAHIVRQLAAHDHILAVYHRGATHAHLPQHVQHIIEPHSPLPLLNFLAAALDFAPEVVIHTIAMGAADAEAAVQAFAARAARLVLLSSGDVYRAYGRFTTLEPGPIEPGPLSEDAPLRTVLFPYRAQASSPNDLQYWYEKILAERAVLNQPGLSATVLRLPKVYGPESNDDLATIYAYRHHPDWRWTHGFVENVAHAVVIAATHPRAAGKIYNVGEAYTPTISERLRWLPPSSIEPDRDSPFNFAQNICYDTTRIRTELGYRELIPEYEALLQTLRSQPM